MKWITRFLPGRRAESPLPAGLREALAHWSSLPPAKLDRNHTETRYVVLNTRASSVNADRATLQSVAAIAVEGGHIAPEHSLHAVLDDEFEARLTGLVTFVGAGPVVVFNAALNRALLERAFRRHLGIAPEWLWLDLYWLLPALFGEAHAKPVRLSQWMDSLGLGTFQRYHALGDAWVLARLLLALQSRALAEDRRNPLALADLEASLRAVAHR
jgi:DNA polymerase III subunit epsilon